MEPVIIVPEDPPGSKHCLRVGSYGRRRPSAICSGTIAALQHERSLSLKQHIFVTNAEFKRAVETPLPPTNNRIILLSQPLRYVFLFPETGKNLSEFCGISRKIFLYHQSYLEDDGMVKLPEIKPGKLFDLFKTVHQSVPVNKKLS